MAWFFWCVLGGALGECVVTRRGCPVGWRVAALLAWVVLLAGLLVYSFAGDTLSDRGAVSAVALGFLAAVAFGLVVVAFKGVGYAGRRSGLIGWAGQNKARAAASVAALVVVGAGFVGYGLSSVSVAEPLPVEAAPVVLPPAGAVDSSVLSARVGQNGAVCPCDVGLFCVGPRGGKYCVTDAGKKRYL